MEGHVAVRLNMWPQEVGEEIPVLAESGTPHRRWPSVVEVFTTDSDLDADERAHQRRKSLPFEFEERRAGCRL